jgi:VanZ family protein
MPDKLPFLLRRAMRWLFLPALAVVAWGELKPSSQGPEGWDKVLHFTAYFGLTGIATVALGNRRLALWAAFALAVFGGILEIVQGFVGRDAEWSDEFANVVGVCFGLAAGLAILRILAARNYAGQGGADETVR